MKPPLINVIFILIYSFCFSQRDEKKQTVFNQSIHHKIYLIKFPNIPVKLEIIKYLDKSLSGSLISSLEKNTKEIDLDNYDDSDEFERVYNIYNYDVYDIHQLDNSIINYIYFNLLNDKIKLLKKCNSPFDIKGLEDPNFLNDCNNYLHGPSARFVISSNELEKSISIPILGLDIDDKTISDLPEKQKKAQKIITLINGKVDINKEFLKAQKRIINLDKKHPYSYFTRGYIIVTLNTKKQ